ncbi:MAG: hypothetical protein JWO69_532 [Thermoleophilia bacterium]|jgi:hypothetical protein|nr:hypothetical protein [Thermoleophilia bacterium]
MTTAVTIAGAATLGTFAGRAAIAQGFRPSHEFVGMFAPCVGGLLGIGAITTALPQQESVAKFFQPD